MGSGVHRGIVHHDILDFRQKFPEHLPVLFEAKLLGLSRKSHRGFLYDKFVHQRRQNMEP